MTTNNIHLAEQNFEQFIPLIRKYYPNGKLDKKYAKDLVAAYKAIDMSEDVLIALYDNSSASVFFVSDNVRKYNLTPETVIKWGGLLLFKMLHYSHYSFAYNAIKQEYKFNKTITKQNRIELNKIYCSGLKLVDGNGQIKRAFIKGKQIQLNNDGQTNVSVYFLEEIPHLVKGNHYWFRLENGKKTVAYIQQKGKKNFTDILSNREKDILNLLAQQKTSQQIGEELFLSKLTVETHRKNMIKRIGAVNSTAMVHLCKMANLL